jgi:benzoyl-CoA reductase/2-hydroxyglutaryl-CoA dehydratase subunit BcrC/BadD/HgdB
MSWENIIKEGKEKYEEARLDRFGSYKEVARIEKIFEKQLKDRRLTPAKAKKLIDFYEKLQGNKFSEEELKDIAYAYTLTTKVI